jgi:hypothetical protein
MASSSETISHTELRSATFAPSSGMNASTFLPVVCEATLRILSRYVLELSVNATILVGSFSRMITRESAKICSEAELARQHLT